MTKSISSRQFAERDTFIKGSDCQRLERRMQPRFNKNLISTQNKSKDLEEIGEFLHQRYRDLISSLADDPTYYNLNKKKKKIRKRGREKKKGGRWGRARGGEGNRSLF